MGAIAAIGGALIQGRGAKRAAQAQERAAQADIAFQKETRDLIRGDLGVYREGGNLAQRALDFELGLGGRPMIDGQEYGGWQKDPTYQFRLDEGMNALNASHAARSGVLSGAALRDSMQYNQNFASNERGNYLSRLGARADTGMNAAQMSGAASQQAAAGVSNALGNIGNAQAAGAIGRANAWTGGIQNMLGAWNYQRNMNAAQGTPGAQPMGGGNWTGINGNSNIFNGLFGGKGLGI